MTVHAFTEKEKLAEIETIIVALKRDGSRPRELAILKAIAADIVAHMPGADVVAVQQFERLVMNVERSRNALGYKPGAMIELALNFITQWPTLRAALIERAKREKETA